MSDPPIPGGVVTLLAAVNSNQTSPTYDLGLDGASDTFSVQCSTAGTVTAFNVQLQGSDDGVNFVNAGTAVTTAGITRITGVGPFRYVQAVLTAFAGTGTLTVTLVELPDF